MLFVNKLKVLTLMTCLVLVGQGFAAWDGSIATTAPETETGADGKTYYLIDSEAKLAWFAEQVNGGQWSYNAKLIANLDMSNPDPSKKSLWTPIAVGNGSGGSKVFKGTFDGNKHVISNLYISAEELITKYYGQPINNNNGQENGTAQNLGFIGCLTGTVKNLIIENIEVHGYGKGGLGENKNLVDKPLSIGTVVGWQSTDASVIEGCYVTGVVITSGDGQAVGGIVGNVGSGTVRNCYSAVDVYASGLAYVGGIAGYTKKYSGNLVTMESCVYAGETLSTEGSAQVAGKDSSGRAGAIIGYQYKGTVTLSNLYYDQEQFPGENAGIGATTGGSTTGSTTAQPNVNSAETICLLNKGTFTDGVCNKNSPWEMGESGPVLIEYSSDGYKITFDANGGFFAGNVTSAVKYIKLDNFINDDGLTKPTRDDFAFVGWSTNKDATEPDQNLGTVSGAAKFYAVWNPIYTITFGTINGDNHGTFSDGSSTPKTVEIEKGKRISVQGFDRPTSYTENDVKYNFVGWAFAEAPADALVEGGLDNLPLATKDTTLLAVWTTAPVYTVSFFANGSTTASYVSTVYQNDKAAELTVDKMDPNPGYTFLGWYEDLNGESFDFNTVINRDVNLFAKWEKDSYNITYENLNGAANPNPSTYTVDGLALQVLSLDDAHKFEGWCTDYELKNCITEIAPGKTGALTLYAKWSDVTYAIIYRAAGSGATGNVSQGVKYHGVPYTLLGESYNRPGYKQNGWTTTLTGDKIYDYGDSYEVDASITFYPTWDIAHYTITYVCDGCTDFNNPTSYTKFDNGDLKFKNPIYPGPDQYYWGGWFKDAAFTQSIQIIKKGSYGDTTIYAKLLKYYNIDYDLGGKNVKANNTARYHVEFAVELKAPDPSSIDGYTFAGWYDNPAFAGDPVTEIPLGSTGDKTFYAKWIPETYTITYVIDGVENAIDPETYTIEDAVTLAAPTRDGYEFDGWYTNAEFNGNKVTSIVAGTTGDTTFFAKWTPVEYSITYVLEEGASNDNDNPASYTVETDAFTLKDAVKNGYTFEGWFNGEGEKVTTVAGGATGNLELTAQFTIETYTITYHNIEGASFETSNPTTYTVEDVFPIALNSPSKTGFNFLGWSLVENSTDYVAGIAAGSKGDANFYANWELAPSPITVTASSGTFDYDKQTHNATCSYEGTLPTGYSIDIVPSGSVQNVADGEVTTSCAVTITDESGDDVTDLFTELTVVDGTISVVEKEDDYGAIVVYTSEKGKRAELNGSYNGSISDGIPNDLEVDSIQFNRKFPISEVSGEGYSTIVLPFTIAQSKVVGAEFYQLAYVEGDNVAIYPVADAIQANTPYIIRTSAQTLKFNLDVNEKVAIDASQMNNTLSTDKMWELRGMYSYKKWEADNEELGRAYGFTTKVIGDNGIGSFARNAAGAYIYPFRVYLYHYSAPVQRARALAKSANISSIDEDCQPGSLNVIIVDPETEETTVIGKLNPATGEVKVIDNWYDMKGRRLNAKPTTKGIYYFNGKRVIIK